MDLQNKVVWIIGASSGIGEALACESAKQGARIVLSARREEELNRVAIKTGLASDRILLLPLDLEKTGDVGHLTEQILKKFGTIDVLINNAGVGQISASLRSQEAIERKIVEINFWGHVSIAKAVAQVMVKQGSGKIVVIGSILGKFGLPLYAAYAASKHALYGYFESLREELHPYHVKVLLISPGFISTGISEKSLTYNGELYNKPSIAQKNGMPAEVCARKIIKQVKSNRLHKYIGRLEIGMVYFKYYLPGLFYWLIRKTAPAKL